MQWGREGGSKEGEVKGRGVGEWGDKMKGANSNWYHANRAERKVPWECKDNFARTARRRFRCQSRTRHHRSGLIGKLQHQTELEKPLLLKRYRVANWQQNSYCILGAGRSGDWGGWGGSWVYYCFSGWHLKYDSEERE